MRLRALILPFLVLTIIVTSHSSVSGDQATPSPDSDQQVIDQLRQAGSDVTKPTDVVYYLYIPAKHDADAAAATLNAKGYKAHVEPPLGKLPDGTVENRFSVVAHIT